MTDLRQRVEALTRYDIFRDEIRAYPDGPLVSLNDVLALLDGAEGTFVSAAKVLREIASAALREATAANEGEHPIECWAECTCGRLGRMAAIHQACVRFDAALAELTTHTTPRGEA